MVMSLRDRFQDEAPVSHPAIIEVVLHFRCGVEQRVISICDPDVTARDILQLLMTKDRAVMKGILGLCPGAICFKRGKRQIVVATIDQPEWAKGEGLMPEMNFLDPDDYQGFSVLRIY